MNRSISFIASLVILAACDSLSAQEWFRRTPTTSPPARQQHAMAYDAARGEVLLFGGLGSGSTKLGDTWTWNGTDWKQRSVSTAPTARSDHSMAYDANRRVVVLFGGWDTSGTQRNDAWFWNGTTWVPQFSLSNPPSMTQGHEIAFNATNQKITLYGSPGFARYETWDLAVGGWTKRTPTLSPTCCLRAMSMNPVTGRPFAQVSPGAAVENWEFDGTIAGNSWSRVGTTTPRFNALTPAPNSKLLGFTGAGFPVKVFERAGSNSWSQRLTTSTPNRLGAIAFDSSSGLVVLFSPSIIDSSTWEFDNDARRATASVTGSGCGTPNLKIAPAIGSRPLLGIPFHADVTNVPAGAAVMAIGLSNSLFGAIQLPVSLSGFGLNGCTLYQDVAFGSLAIPMSTSTTGRFTITLPVMRNLLGGNFHYQAIAPAPGVNPAGIVTSNLMDCIAGNY